ncbi:long-chain-fatty-acid--CoA ligase [Aureimonas glaciei]|uniref:Long-chain-fatty-acid--CoA ligase n=1 Tax=Aureimonas glaciei TaxID=1776957 RepID=A0A916YDU7_9HYPH|nr:long-chain-fatty-acid--CoA ligase [Aureimonas glaciei]GGD40822.1 long-chain-fatty-acid--CoA ligase [Aureimonas glaciei]
MQRPWLAHYPEGIAADLPPYSYRSLSDLLVEAFARHGAKPAFRFMGTTLSFAELDAQSQVLAAYLQSLGLAKGDRVALMMPNVPQYPVAVAAVLRAGMVVVNTNPLYTPRELEHQLSDSGAKAIIVLENMAATLEACAAHITLPHIVVTSIGDMLPILKGTVVNFVLRHVKKLVPAFNLPQAVRWKAAMAKGRAGRFTPASAGLDDIAALQYTGGTTGVSKGAMLLHRNVIANVLQTETWHAPAMRRIPAGEQVLTVCALPLYHIFGFTVNMMLAMRTGGCNLLILNPRDIAATLKELQQHRFHCFPAVNTLFGALARHPDATKVDWSNLRLSVGGGMAVQSATAKLWLETTGCAIVEGYGLSETAPSACCNPVDATAYTGTIGYPLPSTELKIIDDDGRELPMGERGEIAIRGPQVMAGYWNRPDETARVMTEDGFFKSGDIGVMDENGAFCIVDRKKDMINVSGFNVYPNEIEDVVTRLKGVAEAAAIGVADADSGEAVKLFVVRNDPGLTAEAVKSFCKAELTGYKRPKHVEFRDELPKTNVGKVLRRKLRDA